MASSKLTIKFQATVPRDVRALLKLKAGDRIVFEVQGERVEIRKEMPLDRLYLKALESTLEEWNSEIDDEAFRDL